MCRRAGSSIDPARRRRAMTGGRFESWTKPPLSALKLRSRRLLPGNCPMSKECNLPRHPLRQIALILAALFANGSALACGDHNVATYVPTSDPSIWNLSESFYSGTATIAIPQASDNLVQPYSQPPREGGGGGGLPNVAESISSTKDNVGTRARVAMAAPCMPTVVVTASPTGGYGSAAGRFLRVIRGYTGGISFAVSTVVTVSPGSARCDSDESVKIPAACQAIFARNPRPRRGETFQVRFDDGKIQTWVANGA